MYRNDENLFSATFVSRSPSSPKAVPSSRGYFVFAPHTNESKDESIRDAHPQLHEPHLGAQESFFLYPSSEGAALSETATELQDEVWEERKRREEELRQKRLEKEKEVASAGEIEWVRSGGVLRDAKGRRDKVRTEKIAQELRLLAEEKLLTDQWETYESRWRSLVSSFGPICFGDIPWPLAVRPPSLKELAPARICDFLLASLRVRSSTVSRKERLRNSLLRWHPDKISSILGRIVTEDAEAVREGVSIVFNACHAALQEAER